jgi:uncharacterized protein YukE/pimeloyl-ACP methyl ester carboxylesterase
VTAADPLAGDPAAIRSLARRLTERSESVDHGLAKLDRAVGHVHDGWAGAAADRFVSSVEALEPGGRRIVCRIETAADVLTNYAKIVDDIQRDAERIQSARASNAEEISSNARAIDRAARLAESSDAVESDHVALQHLQAGAQQLATLQAGFDAQWQELVARRAAADRAAAEGLADREVVGRALSTASSLGSMSDAAFLAAIAKLPSDELAALGDGVADRLADMPADQVAAWWDSMGGRGSADRHSAAQEALITAMPSIIGNLNGVAYWARDRANRISAQIEFAKAEVVLAAAKKRVAAVKGGPLPQRAVADGILAAAQRQYDALKNFLAGARTTLLTKDPVSRQMVSFHAGHPPLGAFSVGDLDSAASVSYLIPGMGSSLADTTQYMRAGSNVVARQQLEQQDASTAVVAWIGYEAPPNFVASGNPGVFGEGYADRGAPNLISDLAGFRATRSDAQLNVIAHSYGSTTASLALAEAPDLGVHSFVTLGSAGIPASVPDAAATHADHVYAAQAAEKLDIAYIGRKYSVPHRIDPADGFGATRIGTFDGDRVNVHDLMVNSTDHPNDYGYLDSGTESLKETARATLP